MATETTDPGKSQAAATDVSEFITDLDGGQFERMLSVALSQSAAAAVDKQKKAGKPVGARLAIPLALRLEATNMTLGEVIEFCRGIGGPGDTMVRQANGRPLEMSSLSARFHELIQAACGPDAYARFEWPSLHEVRSLSARTYIAEGMEPTTVQTLLGHKHAEMTKVYLDDRGLTEAEWKTVATPAAAANDEQPLAA